MNLFFKRLTGKLHSTKKMEQYIAAMEAEIARYRAVEASPELKEYCELKKSVESKAFAQNKYNLTHTKYKTTKPHLLTLEFRKLLHNKQLMLYLQVKDSAQLKDYLEFRQSPEYVQLSDKKLVRKSPQLKNMLTFEKSKAYKAYWAYKDSKLPTRYLELRELIGTNEFQEEKAFWKNPNRWLTTEGHVQEVRFAQLSSSSDIKFFLATDVKKIEKMESYIRVFNDDFDWFKLADSKWSSGFAYKSKQMKANHSFVNEQQANNGGLNTGTIGGFLTILTKKESATAPAWDPQKGFVTKDFEYTSDIIQTANTFRQKEGLFMVKLRTEGNIHHACWLGGYNKLPLINIFHFNGRNIVVGNLTDKGFDGTSVTGICARKYYIYSLRWTKKELIWYVNNIEVYRTNRNLPQEDLYLALCSFISEKQRATEGKMEVDWARVYSTAE